MKNLLEIHILQNFAPSNLNRDDTGSPKDAFFGGYRRARISSQCLKRAAREYFSAANLLEPAQRGIRTKFVVDELAKRLVASGHDFETARRAASAAVSEMGTQKKFKLGKKAETDYLVFIGQGELERVAFLIDEHFEALAAAKPSVPKELKGKLEGALDGAKAVDVALFGRMLANLPERSQDAACQVAHAISTHAVEREYDFFTAVDDIKRLDEEADAGAGMLGTIEFASACFYRYVALDLEQLRQNLQGDTELLLKGVEALLHAFVRAKPSGKQNSFAAHNEPEYIVCTVRQAADPRNLANAFERPVMRREWSQCGLTAASVERIAGKWRQLEEAYGQAGPTFTLNLTEGADGALGAAVPSLSALVDGTMGAVRDALGA